MDRQRFLDSCTRAKSERKEFNGIGTLGEKTLHSVLKSYYSSDKEKQEIKVGKYIADIVDERGIIEIQTRGFDKLRKKLEEFLKISKVTIVYPIPKIKWIIWIEGSTGKTTKRRRSPKTGSYYDAFFELYKIKWYLSDKNIRLHILMLEIEEYRNLDGWSADGKKGSSRNERIPVDIIEEVNIENIEDYKKLLPSDLPISFTSKDFKRSSGLSMRNSQIALKILSDLGVIKRIGKRGNMIIYQ
jgi:hypothetical protein